MSLHQNKPRTSVATRFGILIKKHPRIISCIQRIMVFIYLFLLFAPFIFTDHKGASSFFSDLQTFSLFVFWGFGWPLIMISTMAFGRIWCGIFCPDGTLTEQISHYGLNRSIPRWMRKEGLSSLILICFTLTIILSKAIYDHSVTAFLLGALTAASILTGFFYGKGRRIWCMYLCPSHAIFIFLSKLSPFYFYVDQKKWNTCQEAFPKIICPPLINIKQMKSTSYCHACGRCIGYKNAVSFSTRTPDHEIVSIESKHISSTKALTLIFGIISLGTSAFTLSTYISGQNAGLPILNRFYLISISSLLLGSILFLLIWIAWRLTSSAFLSWQQLTLGLTPLAGVCCIFSFTPAAFSFLHAPIWIQKLLLLMQSLFLLTGLLFSLWLGKKLIFNNTHIKTIMSMTVYAIAACILAAVWFYGFWIQLANFSGI